MLNSKYEREKAKINKKQIEDTENNKMINSNRNIGIMYKM